ncbi:hypothetical protein FACS189472_13630 [Alphaproteobacteria bacterium]|nr:hypothetical protein FACS189472_13630 [Alphaproteobacteria bacterium]
MPGEFHKNNLIKRSLKRKYSPYDEELVVKKPKIIYGDSTLELSPKSIVSLHSKKEYDNSQNIYGNARDKSNTIDYVNTGLSAANAVVSHASDAVDVAKTFGIGVPETVSKVASTASEFGSAAGPMLSGVGAVTSGVSLGFDIANAKKAGKVTFDNANRCSQWNRWHVSWCRNSCWCRIDCRRETHHRWI